MRKFLTIATVTMAVSVSAQQPAAPAAVDLAGLVMQASRWTARFDESLSGLLFRERYLQSEMRGTVSFGMVGSPLGAPTPSVAGNRGQVLLEANVFLLKAPSPGEFVVYRDVYRVNSRDLQDHTERLQKLLTAGTRDAFAQARRLTDASARHNLGGVLRNVNIPTMPFAYLTPARVRGLAVRDAGRDSYAGLPMVIVEFEERARPTLVRGGNDDGDDVPARGRYWIHPDSGAVLRAQVELATFRSKGRIDVQLALHETLKIWVPKEMTEAWQAANRTTTGFAQYDRFQRLNVSTAEVIK